MSEFYPRNFALARLTSMKATPRMWAWSEEAFVLQVALLLEFVGRDQKFIQRWLESVYRTAERYNKRTHEITDERAAEICDAALEAMPE